MKKQILLLILCIIVFSAVALAQEIGPAPGIPTQDGLPSEEGKSPWKDSVDGIQRTTGSLLETNVKLTAEYQQLSTELTAIKNAIIEQKKKNQDHLLAIQQRQAEINSPADVGNFKARTAEIGRAIGERTEAVKVLRAKTQGLDAKIKLRELHLSGLEVDKRAVLVDRKAQDGSVALQLNDEIATMKEKVASQREQEKYIQTKISGLQPEDQSRVKEVKGVVAEIAAIKARLAEVNAEQQEIQAKITENETRRASLKGDRNIARYQALTEQKKTLEAQIAEGQPQLQEAKQTVAQVSENSMKGMQAQLDDLLAQNKMIEEDIGNLRENIAVLEYTIASLNRYQNRNKPTRK